MSEHPLLRGVRGERHLLLGNEAIVRGALEAGVHMVSCYPGTPSSEVPDTFHALGGEGRYRMEYSVNEKVALEVAAGAALGMTMAPSHRQIKRAAHMAAKRVNEAVENLAEAMDL